MNPILMLSCRFRNNLLAHCARQKQLQLVHPQPLAIISKSFTTLAVDLKILQQRHEQRHDFVERHQIAQDEVEPSSQHVSAYEDGELIAAAAYEADVALIRPHAAIGATGHADAQLFAFQ